jgi:hypothetical protein
MNPHLARDRQDRRARRPRRALGRSGRLAHIDAPRRAVQHHHHRPAAEIPRAQPGGKRLAIHARQLALQLRLQILRRSRRPLLRCLETSSPISPGGSCPSGCAIGRMGSDHWDLVINRDLARTKFVGPCWRALSAPFFTPGRREELPTGRVWSASFPIWRYNLKISPPSSRIIPRGGSSRSCNPADWFVSRQAHTGVEFLLSCTDLVSDHGPAEIRCKLRY